MSYNPKGFNIPDETTIPDTVFGFDFHQVAIYTPSPHHAVSLLEALGYDEWYSDIATLEGYWNGIECRVQAEMFFNYQILHGKELEFVRYRQHPDSEQLDSRAPFISHISAYVDNLPMAVRKIWQEHRLKPYHVFTTSGHTNPRVAGRKHFKEAIFAMPPIGFNLKLIEKVIEE